MMYGNDRGSMREVFLRAWQKHRDQQPLEGVERLIVDIALHHPEYQRLLETPDTAHKDYLPELGESNPFMHMGLHIAIQEQLSVDRPQGIRTVYQKLIALLGDAHMAEHAMMDCLAEILWQAQRDGRAPDQDTYLTNLERLANPG
jgi:hypothetical protein